MSKTTIQRALEALACTCLRCGHRWPRRGANRPRVCARCHSTYWDVPRTRQHAIDRAAERDRVADQGPAE